MPFTELVGTSTLMELDGVRRTTVSTVSQSLPPLGIIHDGREVRPHGRKGRTHGIARAHVKDGDVDSVLVHLAIQLSSLLGKGKLTILIAGQVAIGTGSRLLRHRVRRRCVLIGSARGAADAVVPTPRGGIRAKSAGSPPD